MNPVAAILPGLVTGLSLIIAIGAQNAFVIRQGLTRRFVFEVALVSAALDATLILLGTAGLGAVIQTVPVVFEFVRWFGVAYLVWFGISSVRRAFATEVMSLEGDAAATRRGIVISTVTFSLLNPHVYLDTVVFLARSPTSLETTVGGSRSEPVPRASCGFSPSHTVREGWLDSSPSRSFGAS